MKTCCKFNNLEAGMYTSGSGFKFRSEEIPEKFIN